MLELIVLLKDVSECKEDSNDIMVKYKIGTNNNDGHKDGCIRFIQDYDIHIDNVNDLTSYEISIYIAEMGYPNIHVEGMSMLIYLPKLISDSQYKWFKDNRKLLSRFRLIIASVQEDDNIKYIEDSEYEPKSIINKFYKELKKKELLKKRMLLEDENNIKKM